MLDIIRLLPSLPDQVRLAEFDQHLFGTRRDQRRLRPDHNLPLAHLWAGNLGKFHFAGLEVLEDLLQR